MTIGRVATNRFLSHETFNCNCRRCRCCLYADDLFRILSALRYRVHANDEKHCEEAKREIAAVEFTGKIVDVKDERLHIRLAEPLLFSKVLPVEYPYRYDDREGILQLLANKPLLHYAKTGMCIEKMQGSDSIVVNNRSFAIYDKKYGRWQ